MISAFKQALDKAGLTTKETVIPDGRLRRIHVEGDKPGSKSAWYILYNDGVAAGAFGCWKRQINETWCAKADRDLTPTELREYRLRMDETKKAREVEEQERRKQAREKAFSIWKAAPLAPADHPYLIKKTIKNHGLRLHKGALVVPLRDNAGTLHSLQFIDGDGNKRFLSGGRKSGCYFPIGTPAGTICIAEGYATAASVYEATGHATAVAFDAGNLLLVAQGLRAKFSNAEIILCADNDEATPGNPGLTKAREAAAAVGALLAVPPCAGDFNDLYRGVAQ